MGDAIGRGIMALLVATIAFVASLGVVVWVARTDVIDALSRTSVAPDPPIVLRTKIRVSDTMEHDVETPREPEWDDTRHGQEHRKRIESALRELRGVGG